MSQEDLGEREWLAEHANGQRCTNPLCADCDERDDD